MGQLPLTIRTFIASAMVLSCWQQQFCCLFASILHHHYHQIHIIKASPSGNPSAYNIPLGSTLHMNESWLSSPNGTFSAGLLRIGPRGYGLAIWYSDLLLQPAEALYSQLYTIVWVANRDSPVNDQGCTVSLSNDGSLMLADSKGYIFWSSNSSSNGVQGGFFSDTGNLALLKGPLGGTDLPVWQSFSYPTDTLLPNQDFLGSSKLISCKSRYDFTSGRYILSITGSLLALSSLNTSQTYWTQANTAHFKLEETGTVELNDGLDNLLYLNASNPARTWARLKLDDDGNLRTYKWINGTWVTVWRAMILVCNVYGLCGPFGICTYWPNLSCTCAPGFHMTDPGDWSQGCTRNIPLQCDSASSLSSSKYVRVLKSDFYNNDLHWDPNITEEACTSLCLSDCTCLAAAYQQGRASCFRKGNGQIGPAAYILNGYQAHFGPNTVYLKVSINDSSATNTSDTTPYLRGTSLSCQANGILPTPATSTAASAASSSRNASRWRLQIGMAVAVTLAELACFAVAWGFLHRAYAEDGEDMMGGTPTRYTYEEMEAATAGFSRRLGEGTYGVVYRGVLPDGREVAVKRLKAEALRKAGGEKEFRAEVGIIGKIHHRNLVALLGFCAEGANHRMLVYEFVTHGSLASLLFFDGHASHSLSSHKSDKVAYLHDYFDHAASDHEVAPTAVRQVAPRPLSHSQSDGARPPPLSWAARLEIALGAARAITYLHEECQDHVLHCDIKPPNILIDANLQAKVADFGLAKLSDREHTLSMSMVRGTRGYLAPEWADNTHPITCKADVYSFGVVLLELVSGRRNYDFSSGAMDENEWDLAHWAWSLMQRASLLEIVDPKLLEASSTLGENTQGLEDIAHGAPNVCEIEKVINIAFWCLQVDVEIRPCMAKVVHMLQGILTIPLPPTPNILM